MTNMRRCNQSLATSIVMVSFLLPLLAGCGNTVSVSGKITMDSVPLATGRISFEPPPDESGKAFYLNISNGTYSGNVSKGTKFVRIESQSVTDNPSYDPNDYMKGPAKTYKSIIPAKYNGQTTLKVEITKGATHDFALTTE